MKQKLPKPLCCSGLFHCPICFMQEIHMKQLKQKRKKRLRRRHFACFMPVSDPKPTGNRPMGAVT
jgi:hypothetical protein